MTVPTLIFQAVFVIATGACFLLIGAALGATIFADLGGHGLATIGSILKGACIGAATGCAIAILLIIKYQFGKSALMKGVGVSLLATMSMFLFIQVLDFLGYW